MQQIPCIVSNLILESVSHKSSSDSDRAGHIPETHTDPLDKDNPFDGVTSKELAAMVKNYTETDPELAKHFELLKFGAQLAQHTTNALSNPLLFEEFKDLSSKQRYYLGDNNKEVEKDAPKSSKFVREDNATFWVQSKTLQGSVLSTCLAGIIQ